MIENENATLKALLENPLGYIGSTDSKKVSSQIPNLFKKIAQMLFERYDILIHDSQGKEHYYSFAEVEFYYHKKGILERKFDNCVYPRTCEAGKFLWHDTGVDICFKSECDIEDYYFGGILIRSLIDNESKQVIGGPGRCANVLAFLGRAGETPQLHPKENVQQVKLCQTVRQGIKCDVGEDGKAKVKYCYFIEMKDGNWTRTKEIIKKKSDFSGYTKETVTFRYPDNPENRAEKFK